MAQTEKLLTDAFWQLLGEKVYKKITVKDIVDLCQVNRNTFYYHFEGIPSLLEQAVRSWADMILSADRPFDTPVHSILPIAEACASRRTAILNLLNSKAREIFLSGLEDLCTRAAERCVSFHRGTEKRPVLSEKDRTLLIRFYKAILYGCLSDWLNGGMEGDFASEMARAASLAKEAGW